MPQNALPWRKCAGWLLRMMPAWKVMAAPRVECPEQHSGSQKQGGFIARTVGY